jgi:hypothetical protein
MGPCPKLLIRHSDKLLDFYKIDVHFGYSLSEMLGNGHVLYFGFFQIGIFAYTWWDILRMGVKSKHEIHLCFMYTYIHRLKFILCKFSFRCPCFNYDPSHEVSCGIFRCGVLRCAVIFFLWSWVWTQGLILAEQYEPLHWLCAVLMALKNFQILEHFGFYSCVLGIHNS